MSHMFTYQLSSHKGIIAPIMSHGDDLAILHIGLQCRTAERLSRQLDVNPSYTCSKSTLLLSKNPTQVLSVLLSNASSSGYHDVHAVPYDTCMHSIRDPLSWVDKSTSAQQPDLAECKDGAHKAAIVGAKGLQGQICAQTGPHEGAQHSQGTPHSTVASSCPSEPI